MRRENQKRAFVTTTFRRKVVSVFLGFFYGGSLANGIARGSDFVLRSDDTLTGRPVLTTLVMVSSAGLAAFLGSHSSKSVGTGIVACATILPFFLLTTGSRNLNILGATVGAALGVGLAVYGSRISVPAKDIERARLFGVRWPHWLWLWLPWQGVVANGVWLAYPLSLLGTSKPPLWTLVGDVVKIPIMLGLLALSVLKAVECIREDAPLSRFQATIRFVGWFLLFPILVNLLRVLDFL
jgi:hypothetical protein